MLLKNLRNRAANRAMIQVLERTLDPCVTPARVLLGHPDDQPANLLHHTRTANSLSRIGPLCGDEFTVPRQDRIGRHDGGNLPQDLLAQRLPLSRQSATLVVRETESFPARRELFFENTILFD